MKVKLTEYDGTEVVTLEPTDSLIEILKKKGIWSAYVMVNNTIRLVYLSVIYVNHPGQLSLMTILAYCPELGEKHYVGQIYV